MKKITTACCLILSLTAMAQVNSKTQVSTRLPPTVYIDSQKVDFPIDYLDPANFRDISVEDPAPAGNTGGKIFITWKYPHPVFLTLSEIAREKGLAGHNTLFFIDDLLIRDTSLVRIDRSFIVRMDVVSTESISYLNKTAAPMQLLFMETKRHRQKKTAGGKELNLR